MEGIDTIPNTDADNALILGTALHTGIEEGVEQALDFYKNSFPVLTDDHIHEMMKLEAMIPKAKAMLPPGGTFELPIGNADFIGFMDYLVPVGKGLKLDGLITGEDLNEFEAFDLYDFKYSNNAKNYAVSGQLHEYKYWYELTHPGHRIRNMYFLIVPKPKIRQKSTETLSQFRDRLQAALKDAEPTLMPVQYNPMKIVDFLTDVKHMVEATDFPKNPNHFCGWCEYEEYCQKGWDYMLLPKNERRDLNATKKKVVWLYGAPFSGKTFFANQFPDPLMLNTDGNIKFVDAPYIAIRDTVTVEGRITKRKLAYEVFMDAVAELEKKQNDFRTIVVDLLEDVYESCRVYICDRQGWKHESDDSFRAWDMVRSEFLNTLKRLVNLDYENIILISHEDRSRDLTRKGGDKISSIKPNLQDMREIFLHAKTVHFFRLGTSGVKAANTYATAKYPGTRGNDLRTVITANENTTEQKPLFDVATFLGTVQVDLQEGVAAITDLKVNAYVDWKSSGTLSLTASLPLTGGTNGTVADSDYQTYLDQAEAYTFNAMGCTESKATITALFAAFAKRMRDDVGKKFQVVLFRKLADYEGVVSVKNGLTSDKTSTALIPWVTGVIGGTAVNKSATNMTYDGEYDVDTDFTQTQLENGIREGSFMFHRVDKAVCVLTDINSFISITDEKSSDFSSNQTIRVLDQIANDIAVLFGKKYLGKVPNDAAGRISLWNDIVKHHTELQDIRAIENFSGENVTVEKGDTKKSVVVTDYVTPVNAMEQLYMTVYVQ